MDPSEPCNVGSYISYAVNVSSVADLVATIKFANDKNVRFLVRNTGHE